MNSVYTECFTTELINNKISISKRYILELKTQTCYRKVLERFQGFRARYATDFFFLFLKRPFGFKCRFRASATMKVMIVITCPLNLFIQVERR